MLTDRLTGFSNRIKLGKLRDQIRQKAMSLTEPPPMCPRLTMEYVVRGGDTLERIAASHDCTVGEVIKLNRMATRMVFQGQKILVPVPLSDEVFDPAPGNGIIRGPGGAVPRRGSLAKTQSAPVGPRAETMDETDTDCLQRFIKMKVKQLTESDGTVSGTLLVTPNCLMFDPDVTHPLVKENGSDLYGMVANMDEIIAVSVYKEIGGLLGTTGEKAKEIFDPEHLRTRPQSETSKASLAEEENKENSMEDSGSVPTGRVTFGMPEDDDFEVSGGLSPVPPSSLSGSGELPSIVEESTLARDANELGNRRDTPGEERRRAVSDSAEANSTPSSTESRSRTGSDLDPEAGRKSPFGKYSPNAARRSFGKLGRTLSARARSVGGTVVGGAQTVARAGVHGTKTVAHGVVSHTRSVSDAVEKGVTTTAKVVANGTKAAADAVVSMPGNIVNMGQTIVNDGMAGVNQMCDSMFAVEEELSPTRMKREQSMATLESLKARTQVARDEAAAKAKDGTLFSCATSSDEMPELFTPVDQMINSSTSSGGGDHTTDGQPVLPYYMAVRLTRKKRKAHRASSRSTSVGGGSHNGNSNSSSYEDEFSAFGNKLKREFWFAVPPSQADNIYHFLLQWSPDKYGQDTTLTPVEEAAGTASVSIQKKDDRGFIVLDSEADESLTGCSSRFAVVGNPVKANKVLRKIAVIFILRVNIVTVEI